MNKSTISDILWEQAINDNNFAQAEKIYKHLLATSAATAEHHTVMGLWYQQMRDYNPAVNAFLTALKQDKQNADELYYQIALCYFEKENYSAADKYLDLSLKEDPDFTDALFLKAETSAVLDDKEAALTIYKKLLNLLPDDVQLCIAVAASVSELGYNDTAIEIYNHALLLEPENYYLYSNLGVEYTELAEYDDALFCHERALKLNSFCADLWYNLACTCAQCDRLSAALDALEKAVTLDEANKEYAKSDEELSPLYGIGRFWKLTE